MNKTVADSISWKSSGWALELRLLWIPWRNGGGMGDFGVWATQQSSPSQGVGGSPTRLQQGDAVHSLRAFRVIGEFSVLENACSVA